MKQPPDASCSLKKENKQTAEKCKQTHEFLQDTLLYKWTEIPLYFVTISLQQHLTLYLGTYDEWWYKLYLHILKLPKFDVFFRLTIIV